MIKNLLMGITGNVKNENKKNNIIEEPEIFEKSNMIENSTAYAEFKEKQIKLSQLIWDTMSIIEQLNMNKDKAYLNELINKVNNDNFKIQVVGTFKNGKSTFINSFLGSDVLPAYATPCTAVINEVKYDKEKKALLYFKDPIPDKLASNIPENVLKHIKEYGKKDIPPIEIPEKNIEDYAVIPIGKELNEISYESPYEKIELFWPVEILKNGVEIIDSPGLNEHETRTRVTCEYLDKADAILFILAADKLCSADEMNFIKTYLKNNGHDDVFFVVNRFDTLRNERDKKRTVDYAKIQLIDYTAFKEDGIFFISALDALDGKIDNNIEQYQNSGMPKLENSLSNFLVNGKGKIKLAQPAKELKRIIKNEVLEKEIPMQLKAFNSSLNEIIKKREDAEPKIKDLKEQRSKLSNKLDILINNSIPDIEDKIKRFFMDLNTNIPEWINEYEISTAIPLAPTKAKIEPVIEEILNFIRDKIETEQFEWQNKTLAPIIQNKFEIIQQTIENKIEEFYCNIDKIKFEFSSVENVEQTEDIPVWQRLIAAGGGFMVSGVAGAALGGMEGFSKDFVKGIITQFAVFYGLAIVGLLNPVTIFIAIVSSILISLGKSTNKIESKIKKMVAKEICDSVNKANIESGDKIINDIRNNFYTVKDKILKSLDCEIANLEEYMDGIIKELKNGEKEVARKKESLSNCLEQLKTIYNKTDTLIS